MHSNTHTALLSEAVKGRVKMRNMKMRHHKNYRGRKCETWKCGTKWQGWKMRGTKMRHQMTGVENARKAAMERLHDLR